jgi:pimeloyl-ACP methyl ester carboxylesterase
MSARGVIRRRLAVVLVGAALLIAAMPAEQAPARSVELPNGREMYLTCRGHGGPTVILVSGYHGAANAWSVRVPGSDRTPVLPGASRFARVCAYDRPGTVRNVGLVSRSDPVPMPRTTRDAVRELHAMLRAADLPGPYVLVGHSLGGMIVRHYASTFPRQVAGLVLVDALNERLERQLGPDYWARYVAFQYLPLPGFEDYRDAEVFDFAASARQMRRAAKARPLRPKLPVYVLSKGQSFGAPDQQLGFPTAALDRAWRQAQNWLARLLPHTPHVIATDGDHNFFVSDPQLVIKAIRDVVRRVYSDSGR